MYCWAELIDRVCYWIDNRMCLLTGRVDRHGALPQQPSVHGELLLVVGVDRHDVLQRRRAGDLVKEGGC